MGCHLELGLLSAFCVLMQTIQESDECTIAPAELRRLREQVTALRDLLTKRCRARTTFAEDTHCFQSHDAGNWALEVGALMDTPTMTSFTVYHEHYST